MMGGSMKLLFKQRLFSWFDSYDIYDENGNTVYVVKGKLAWGHLLKIYDSQDREVGTVRERILTFLPKFEIYEKDTYLGSINRELTLFRPRYNIEFKGWQVSGDFMQWDYTITDAYGKTVAVVAKELFHLTDTYSIDVMDPKDALYALMFVLAVDAEKCSRN